MYTGKHNGGYWFEGPGKITICWRNDGSLAMMDSPVKDKPTRLMVNGVWQSVATRLTGSAA